MLDTLPVTLALGTVLGFLSGLGVGGGSLLMLWLTLCLGRDQETARVINLLFFLPAAAVACRFRWRQGVLDLKKIFPAILTGCLTAILFSWLGAILDTLWLKKAFGALLLFTGARELLYKKR